MAHAELFEHVGELVAKEEGHDGGRGFVATKAAVIGSGAHRGAQEARMAVQGADDGAEEDEELGVLVRVVAGGEEVAHFGAADGVVQVLARAVDAVEGLLVQEAGHAVAAGRLAEHRHDELVMVAGEVAGLIGGGDLVLAGGDFVVAGLHRHAKAVKLAFHVGHEGKDAAGDDAVILVVEFLALGGMSAEDGAACDEQVGAGGDECAIDEEVFLLKAAVGADGHGGLNAEEAKDAGRLLVQGLVGAQDGGLLVEGDTRPREEDGGDTEHHARRAFHKVGRAGHVPCGIAAGLEGGAQAAGGEARTVGFALHEGTAAELGNGAALAVRVKEAVMLFGGEAGEGIEDVGVMVGTAFHGPGLHGVGHYVSYGRVEAMAEVDGRAQGLIDVLRQVAAHGLVVEDIATEVFRGIGGRADLRGQSAGKVLCCRAVGGHGIDGVAAGIEGTHSNSREGTVGSGRLGRPQGKA